eukprot:1183464-Prorocentrum_minimum.AAC.6
MATGAGWACAAPWMLCVCVCVCVCVLTVWPLTDWSAVRINLRFLRPIGTRDVGLRGRCGERAEHVHDGHTRRDGAADSGPRGWAQARPHRKEGVRRGSGGGQEGKLYFMRMQKRAGGSVEVVSQVGARSRGPWALIRIRLDPLLTLSLIHISEPTRRS